MSLSRSEHLDNGPHLLNGTLIPLLTPRDKRTVGEPGSDSRCSCTRDRESGVTHVSRTVCDARDVLCTTGLRVRGRRTGPRSSSGTLVQTLSFPPFSLWNRRGSRSGGFFPGDGWSGTTCGSGVISVGTDREQSGRAGRDPGYRFGVGEVTGG